MVKRSFNVEDARLSFEGPTEIEGPGNIQFEALEDRVYMVVTVEDSSVTVALTKLECALLRGSVDKALVDLEQGASLGPGSRPRRAAERGREVAESEA